jgi:hypothetical protein
MLLVIPIARGLLNAAGRTSFFPSVGPLTIGCAPKASLSLGAALPATTVTPNVPNKAHAAATGSTNFLMRDIFLSLVRTIILDKRRMIVKKLLDQALH